MSVSLLSLTRPLDTVSGFLQVASLLGLALLLLKAAQFYWHRQWLLKAIQQFPSPPSHWFFGHRQEVGRGWTGRGRAGRDGAFGASSQSVDPSRRVFVGDLHRVQGNIQLICQFLAPHPNSRSSSNLR